MLRPGPSRALLAALLAMLCLAPPASARLETEVVRTPLVDAALEPQAPFALTTPAFGQVTSTFGLRWGRMHHGIDIGVLEKLGVVAAATGSVTHTGYLPHFAGYGQVILIDHGEDRVSLYSHLSRIRVAPGDLVEAGAWIGNAGCTGSCTGTHLHFELRVGGEPVDPLPFLASAS